MEEELVLNTIQATGQKIHTTTIRLVDSNLFHLDHILKIQQFNFNNCSTLFSSYRCIVDKGFNLFKDY